MNKPLVIDIYHEDQVDDFQAVKDFGIVGVIHKASQGKHADPLYGVRRKAFTDIGMKWGAYCFFEGTDPVAEADYFLSVAEPDADTLVALDWENWPDDNHAPEAPKARKFLERISEKLDRKAVIYSGNVAKEKLPRDDRGNGIPDPFFGGHRLWLCQYGLKWKVHPSWTTPWLWQNNGDAAGPGPHKIPGIQGNCDNNCLVDPMTVDQMLSDWST
jgi:lysozyme